VPVLAVPVERAGGCDGCCAAVCVGGGEDFVVVIVGGGGDAAPPRWLMPGESQATSASRIAKHGAEERIDTSD
jgi:hypothetical protein